MELLFTLLQMFLVVCGCVAAALILSWLYDEIEYRKDTYHQPEWIKKLVKGNYRYTLIKKIRSIFKK